MHEPAITCPNCGHAIQLSESLAAPLIEQTRRQFETQLKQQRAEIEKNEKAAAQRAAALELEQQGRQIAELNTLLKAREAKLTEAQQAQAEVLRQQRALEDERRELDLTVEKRIQDGLAAVQLKSRQEAEAALGLKLTEREEQIASMQRQIEALKQKAEQGSQQLQGEAQELELEARLGAEFPQDQIAPVPKGQHGGDVLQTVTGPQGRCCGKILWESKRTKNWSDGWLPKLREDQRAAGAEIALMVSQALPKEVEGFALIDGVWVTSPRFAVPVAAVIRGFLIQVAAGRQALEGQQTKMAQVYQYLTSARFRHHVEAMVEKIADMREDLAKEQAAMKRLWAKREQQIEGVAAATAGMFGDLQGIAGAALGEIAGLEIGLLESGEAAAGD